MRRRTIKHDFAVQVNSVTAQLSERQRRRQCVLVPGHSSILFKVDMLMFVALIYTAGFTPYEIAFLDGLEYGGMTNPRFITNRVVDLIFLIDCILMFFTAYDKPPHATDDGVNWSLDEDEELHFKEVYETDPRKIACAYARSWFIFDLFTIGVSIFDILPVVLSPAQLRSGANTTGSLGFGFDPSGLVVLRVVRTLRLIKLLRLLRVESKFLRWQAKITLDYGQLTMLRCLAMLLISAHWYACTFAMQATMHSSPRSTWMGEDMYSVCPRSEADYDALVASGEIDPQLVQQGTERDAFMSRCGDLDIATWYLASFTWATMVITGTGGTDFYPSSSSAGETFLVCLLVILGAALFTQVLALFCDVATNSNPGEVSFRQSLDDLNDFIEMNNVRPKLGQRLREYFHQQKNARLRHSLNSVVTSLSPSLQIETIMSVHRPWLSKVWFMRKLEAPCLVQVAMSMSELVFAPGEIAPRRHLYVVKWGIVLYGGHVLTSGKQWGEDMILADERYMRPYIARMMTYVGLIALARTKLLGICEHFPASIRALRKATVKLAVRRHLIKYAREIKEEAERASGGNARKLRGDLLTQVSEASSKVSLSKRSVVGMKPNEENESCLTSVSATSTSAFDVDEAVLRATPTVEHEGPGYSTDQGEMLSALPLDAPSNTPVSVRIAALNTVQTSTPTRPRAQAPSLTTSAQSGVSFGVDVTSLASRMDALDDRMGGLASICERLVATVESMDSRLTSGRPVEVKAHTVKAQRGLPPATLDGTSTPGRGVRRGRTRGEAGETSAQDESEGGVVWM